MRKIGGGLRLFALKEISKGIFFCFLSENISKGNCKYFKFKEFEYNLNIIEYNKINLS